MIPIFHMTPDQSGSGISVVCFYFFGHCQERNSHFHFAFAFQNSFLFSFQGRTASDVGGNSQRCLKIHVQMNISVQWSERWPKGKGQKQISNPRTFFKLHGWKKVLASKMTLPVVCVGKKRSATKKHSFKGRIFLTNISKWDETFQSTTKMASKDDLTTEQIARLAPHIKSEHMETIALAYLGLEVEEVANFHDDKKPVAFNREVLITWKNKYCGPRQRQVQS